MARRQGWRLPRSYLAAALMSALLADLIPGRARSDPPHPDGGAPQEAADRPPPPRPDPAITPILTPSPPDPDDGARPGSTLTADESALSAADRQAVNDLLYRDRRGPLLLQRADQQLAADDPDAALETLQSLLDGEEDTFCWLDSRRPASVRRSVAQRFHLMSADLRLRYERLHGAEARRLLEDSRGSRPDLRRILLRRFRQTRAGGIAVHEEALCALDRGEIARAARLWQSLQDDPWLASAITVDIGSDLARMTTTVESLKESPALLPGEGTRQAMPLAMRGPIRVASAESDAESAVDSPSVTVSASAAPWGESPTRHAAWRLPFGSSAPGAQVSTPFPQVRWRAAFVEGGTGPTDEPQQRVEELASGWIAARIDSGFPVAAAGFSLATHNLVITRGYTGVTARSVKGGTIRWTYRTETSVAAALAAIEGGAATTAEALGRSATFSFDDVFAGNSVLGMLTCDDRRVYFVDGVDVVTRRSPSLKEGTDTDSAAARAALIQQLGSSRLVAVPIAASDAKSNSASTSPTSMGRTATQNAAWVLGDGGDGPLAGHFFLGPPLPLDGALYALTEAERQLNLLAIHAETGRLLWKQGLALVDVPIEIDGRRAKIACTPVYADGLLVCPTQIGLLICVDPADGALVWMAADADEDIRRQALRGHHRVFRQWSQPGFANLPHIHRGRVVSMPDHSRYVHCVSLETGASCWPRPVDRGDAQYLAAVTDDLVLLIGLKEAVALALADGTERWRVRTPCPAGRGVLSVGSYLLPTADGCIEILLDRGATRASLLPLQVASAAPGETQPVATVLGNLAACGDWIIATSPAGVALFPQAAPLQRTLAQRLQTQPGTSGEHVRGAEIALTLGDADAAQYHLEAALHAPDRDAAGHKTRAEELLRELLHAELAAGGDSPQFSLDRLRELIREPQHEARWRLERVRAAARLGNADLFAEAASDLLTAEPPPPLPFDGRGTHWVSPADYVRHAAQRLRREMETSSNIGVPSVASGGVVQAVAHSTSINASPADASSTALSRLDDDSRSLTRAAEAAIQEGRIHAAELLLIRGSRSEVDETAAAAAQRLVQVWGRAGAAREGGRLLERLSGEFATTSLPTGESGAQFVQRIGAAAAAYNHNPRQGVVDDAARSLELSPRGAAAVWNAWRRCELSTASNLNIQIRQELCGEQCRSSVASGAAEGEAAAGPADVGGEACVCGTLARWVDHREYPRPPDSSFRLFDFGMLADQRKTSRLMLVDRGRGRGVREVLVPAHGWHSNVVNTESVGHFLPLAGTAAAGVSLLEGRVVWEWTPQAPRRARDRVLIGPYDAGFCAVQSGGELAVLDPIDGRVRWRRTRLDADAGLHANETTGLIGDSLVLVRFDVDQSDYVAYVTATGEELRRGRIDAGGADARRRRRACGRRLVYTHPSGDGWRLCVWDPLEDRYDVDEPCHPRQLYDLTDEGRLAWVTADHRLVVRNLPDQRTEAEHQLTPEQTAHLNAISMFADHDALYVNLARTVVYSRYSTAANELRIPGLTVSGELLCLDSSTGAMRWAQPLTNRSVLLLPGDRLPFLLTMSRVRDHQQQEPLSLMLEILDRSTGETLAAREDLLRTPIVHSSVDVDARRLTLHGLGGRIVVDFPATEAGRHQSNATR